MHDVKTRSTGFKVLSINIYVKYLNTLMNFISQIIIKNYIKINYFTLKRHYYLFIRTKQDIFGNGIWVTTKISTKN